MGGSSEHRPGEQPRRMLTAARLPILAADLVEREDSGGPFVELVVFVDASHRPDVQALLERGVTRPPAVFSAGLATGDPATFYLEVTVEADPRCVFTLRFNRRAERARLEVLARHGALYITENRSLEPGLGVRLPPDLCRIMRIGLGFVSN